jgi:hypothetical protein
MKQDCLNQCPHNGNIKWSDTCTNDRSVFITHVKEVSKDLALIGHAFNTLGFYVATLNFVFQKFGEENHFLRTSALSNIHGARPIVKVAARNLKNMVDECEPDESLFKPNCTCTAKSCHCNYPEIKLSPPANMDHPFAPTCGQEGPGYPGSSPQDYARGPGWTYLWTAPGEKDYDCCQCQVNLFFNGGAPACALGQNVCTGATDKITNFPSNVFKAGKKPWDPTMQPFADPASKQCKHLYTPLQVCARQAICAQPKCKAQFAADKWNVEEV